MNVIDQLKTPQGRIPVHNVRLAQGESPCLEFVPANAAERFTTLIRPCRALRRKLA